MSNAILLRWSIILSSYQYKIHYKKGSHIMNADCLSRLPVSGEVDLSNSNFVQLLDESFDCNFIYLSTPLVSYKEVAENTAKDVILSKLIEIVQNGNSNDLKNVNELNKYFKIRNLLSVQEGCLMYGNRVVIPKVLIPKILEIITLRSCWYYSL